MHPDAAPLGSPVTNARPAYRDCPAAHTHPYADGATQCHAHPIHCDSCATNQSQAHGHCHAHRHSYAVVRFPLPGARFRQGLD
jgi:hypothetical protein